MKSQRQDYDIVIICDDSNSNSMGRVLTLWELARQANMSALIVAAKGEAIWPPLQDSPIVDSIVLAGQLEDGHIMDGISASVAICVKPRAETLAIALPWSSGHRIPLVLDIDDADIEAGLSKGSPLKAFAKSIIRRNDIKWLKWVQSNHSRYPITVSNPVLQQSYGGIIIPHVHAFEDDLLPCEPTKPLDVAFVGTDRPHKGLSQLRDSVQLIADRGFTLTITASAPEGAHDWETWVPTNTLAEGRQIVREAGVVAIPSLDTNYARGQLPSKLIEAMTMGKAIVASDLAPIRWALGDAGILVTPGSVGELSHAIASLEDQQLRRQYEDRARARSREMFAIENYTSLFRQFIEAAMDSKVADS